MKEAGFVISYPDFRRFDGDVVDLVNVQYWHYGCAFIINMGRQVGPFEHQWQGSVPHEELEVMHLPHDKQQRLGPIRKARSEYPGGWFKYDKIWDDRPALDALMQEVVDLLPQMEAWLEDGTHGPNIDPENSPFPWERADT